MLYYWPQTTLKSMVLKIFLNEVAPKEPSYDVKKTSNHLYLHLLLHYFSNFRALWDPKKYLPTFYLVPMMMGLGMLTSHILSDFAIKSGCWESFLMQNWTSAWEHARQVGKILMIWAEKKTRERELARTPFESLLGFCSMMMDFNLAKIGQAFCSVV